MNVPSRAQLELPYLPQAENIISGYQIQPGYNIFCTAHEIAGTAYYPTEDLGAAWYVPKDSGDIYKMTVKTGESTDTSVTVLILTTTGKLFKVPLKIVHRKDGTSFIGGPINGVGLKATSLSSPNEILTFTQICGDALYAHATNGLVYITQDESTWQIDTAGFGSARSQYLALDASQNVYASTFSGIYKQGPTESLWHLLPNSPSSAVFYLFVSRQNVLYAPTNSGLMSSPDGGTTWAFDSAGMGPQNVNSISDDAKGNLYATSSIGAAANFVWMKPAGGTWRSIGAALQSLAYDSLSAIYHPYLTGVVGSDTEIIVMTRFGLVRSNDNGATWRAANGGMSASNIYNFYEFPDGRRITTTDLGLFANDSHDTTWNKTFPQNSYLPGIQFFVDNAKRIYALGAERREAVTGNLLSSYQPKDIFISSDEGKTWQPDTTGLSLFTNQKGNFLEFVDESGTEHLATYDAPHMRLFSKVSGGSWQGDSAGYQAQTGDAPSAFATDKHGMVYLAMNNGASVYKLLSRTISGGAWSEVSTSTLGGVPYLFTATKEGKLIGVGTKASFGYYSGSSWTVIPTPQGISAGSYVSSLSVDSSNKLWAAYGQHVFNTTDLGQHWTVASDTSPTFGSMVSFGDTTYGLNSGAGLFYFISSEATVAAAAGESNEISIVPNPASDRIHIAVSNARLSRVDIFDMLGSTVASLRGTDDIVWNGRDRSSRTVPNGVYVVHIAGADDKGVSFNYARQIVIQR